MNALVQNNSIISCELTAVEMENVNGGGDNCGWSILGYGATLVGSMIGAVGTGGLGVAVGVAATVGAGRTMLNDCLWS